MNNEKILTYLGLAAAKRSVVTGSDLVLKEVRKGKKGCCVLLSPDASDRTKKQISDKCTYYNIPLIHMECDMYELGKRIGKQSPAACAAVTDSGLAAQIIKYSSCDAE